MKLTRMGYPKLLWDNCIELEALMQSNYMNRIYMMNGQLPEAILKGTRSELDGHHPNCPW